MRRSIALAFALLALSSPFAHAQDPKPLPAKIDVGFDPKVDGLPFANGGNYASRGDCIGMSLTAIDRFLRRKAGEKLPAAEKAKKDRVEALIGDPVDHSVAAIAQALSKEVKVDGAKLDDPKLIRAALLRIQESGKPETLGLDSRVDGHCVVLFGFKNGKLLIYDPNFPGETVEWPFDEKKGLGKPPKGDRWSSVAPIPFDRYPVSRDMARIRGECASGDKACSGEFPTIETTVKPAADKKSVTISGKVSRGKRKSDEGDPTDPPKNVFVRINGVLETAPVALRSDGSYSAVIPASKLKEKGENSIQIVAATRYGSFAGFASVPAFTLGERTGIVEELSSPR
ncbi:MAG: hypothetical protein ACAI25_20420 [Planctomycetota bacterium]